MEATVCNYKQSRRRQAIKHMVLKIEGIKDREKAAAFIGKKVTWTTPSGKKMHGEIKSPHGNSGALRAIFEHALPGQALGTKVTVEVK